VMLRPSIDRLNLLGWEIFDTVETDVSTMRQRSEEILEQLGDLISIFPNTERWRVIDVDTLRPPEASRGVGRSYLHMDFVNAAMPPDYVALLCVRPDPLGGGYSRVANIAEAVCRLSPETLACLKERVFVDGKVENLTSVGEDINPFAIVTENEFYPYRYSGRLVGAGVHTKHVRELDEILERNAEAFLLRPGQLLVVNQNLVVHGRNALGVPQEDIPMNDRRLLLHAFVRRKYGQ
jgi:hypothetical protein